MSLSLIAFDADDTLWHNETLFHLSQERFCALLGNHGPRKTIMTALVATERRNLKRYGYGVKGFTLSLIETALEITGGTVPQSAISEILMIGRDMLDHPVETLPGVTETLHALGPHVDLVLVTKGDLLHQEQKIAASGLAEIFDGIEIVSEKTPETYERIFETYGYAPEACAMVGNSLRSDVKPALEAGAWGIHIPYHLTWELEHAEVAEDHPRLVRLAGIADLVPWYGTLAGIPVA